MYGLNILARSSRALSLRLWSAHRRTVCRIAFSAFGLAAGRKETPSLPARQTAVLGRNSYPRKSKRLDRIISLTVSIPAVDELRLLRMQNQPAGTETALQGAPQCPSLLGTSTMADEVVRISFEWDAGKVPHHPHVEGVVQEQIREARAYHPTLRSSRRTRYDAAILHLYRSLQPALDVEARPRAIRMFTDRSQEQFPIDAVEVAPNVDV